MHSNKWMPSKTSDFCGLGQSSNNGENENNNKSIEIDYLLNNESSRIMQSANKLAKLEENYDVHDHTIQSLKSQIEILEREVMHLTHFKTQANDKIQKMQDD